jgi:predicted nucleic acid-binding protein
MALIVFDASVVIALLDPVDALHLGAKKAFDRVAGEDLAIPASALAETLVAPARSRRLEQARARIAAFELRINDITEDVALEAAQLRGRHRGLRLPDALVIATAEVLDATELLTGDANWRRLSKRVRVVSVS